MIHDSLGCFLFVHSSVELSLADVSIVLTDTIAPMSIPVTFGTVLQGSHSERLLRLCNTSSEPIAVDVDTTAMSPEFTLSVSADSFPIVVPALCVHTMYVVVLFHLP